MIEGAAAEKRAGFEECKRLISALLELDWKSVDTAVKKLDPTLSTTQKLAAAVKKQDPKIASRAVLEIAEDLDVAPYVTPANNRELNPYKIGQ